MGGATVCRVAAPRARSSACCTVPGCGVSSDAGVGSLNTLLDPGDLVIADDFVDMTTQRDDLGAVVGEHLSSCASRCVRPGARRLRLRPGVSHPAAGFFRAASTWSRRARASNRRPKCAFCARWATSVGQSFTPEVWLARDIGACYAGFYVVVNHAEGVVKEWEHEELARIFRDDAELVGRILLAALADWPHDSACRCQELRKPTLLR